MRYEFFSGESAAVEEIDPFSWLAGAIILLLMCAAFLIWIIIWAADNGLDTINDWGAQFAIAVVQDILLNQPIKLYIMHVLAVELLRPRLRHIYNILNVVISRSEGVRNGSDYERETFSVAVVQHMSAACRAARSKLCSLLPSSKILAVVTDYDVFLCREARQPTLTTVSSLLIMIPSLLALTNEWVQDGCLSVSITALWTLFLVANDQLLQVSVWALVVPYVFVFLLIMLDLFVLSPRRKRAATPAKHTGLEKHGGKRWRRSERKKSFLSPKPMNWRTKSVVEKIHRGVRLASISTAMALQKAEKRKQEITWRNMNLASFFTEKVSRSIADKNLSDNDAKYRKYQASTLSDDHDQLRVVSAEVLDMRFSSLTKSIRSKKTASLKKRIESYLWRPDTLSSQKDNSTTLTVPTSSRASTSLSTSNIVQMWSEHRRKVGNDASFWSAYNAFVDFDKNQSGYLEINEIDTLAKYIWQKFNPDLEISVEECDDVVDGLLSTLDPEGKQYITFDTFLPWYCNFELSLKEVANNFRDVDQQL